MSRATFFGGLSAAQLCDIIRDYLDSGKGPCVSDWWGPFESALDRVVTQHGRFE